MGKTSKPLRILVMPGLTKRPDLAIDNPENPLLKELSSKGHIVEYIFHEQDYDLVIGPACWRMTRPLMEKYLDNAVAAASKVRYPKAKGDKDEDAWGARATSAPQEGRRQGGSDGEGLLP